MALILKSPPFLSSERVRETFDPPVREFSLSEYLVIILMFTLVFSERIVLRIITSPSNPPDAFHCTLVIRNMVFSPQPPAASLSRLP